MPFSLVSPANLLPVPSLPLAVELIKVLIVLDPLQTPEGQAVLVTNLPLDQLAIGLQLLVCHHTANSLSIHQIYIFPM